MFSKQKFRTYQIPIVLLERKMVANRTQSVFVGKKVVSRRGKREAPTQG